MYGQISTLAFIGVEARPVEVQVRITPGAPMFAVVGLPIKRWQRAASACATLCTPSALAFPTNTSPSI